MGNGSVCVGNGKDSSYRNCRNTRVAVMWPALDIVIQELGCQWRRKKQEVEDVWGFYAQVRQALELLYMSLVVNGEERSRRWKMLGFFILRDDGQELLRCE